MTCTFFGHRDAPETIKEHIRKAVVRLIETQSADIFLVGDEGKFDRMVQGVLAELKTAYPHIDYAVVLSRMPHTGECPDNTIYPEEVALCPKRFAVDRRNRWMISKADLAVVYVTHRTGGAAKFADIARRKYKKVVDIMPPSGDE